MNKETLIVECEETVVGEITEEMICEYKLNKQETITISVLQYPVVDAKKLLLTCTKNYNGTEECDCIFLNPAQALELANDLTKIAKKLTRSNNHVQEKQSEDN